jgi:hypothetical protein
MKGSRPTWTTPLHYKEFIAEKTTTYYIMLQVNHFLKILHRKISPFNCHDDRHHFRSTTCKFFHSPYPFLVPAHETKDTTIYIGFISMSNQTFILVSPNNYRVYYTPFAINNQRIQRYSDIYLFHLHE